MKLPLVLLIFLPFTLLPLMASNYFRSSTNYQLPTTIPTTHGLAISYPVEWQASRSKLPDSGTLSTYRSPDQLYTLVIEVHPASASASLSRILKLTHPVAQLTIAGQPALQPLPRADTPNINAAYFFSPDHTSVYMLDLDTNSTDSAAIDRGQIIFTNIVSSASFN